MKTQIYYATGNKDKYLLSKKYLEQVLENVEILHLAIDLPEEQTLDIQKIARDKAKAAWEYIKQPVLVDDGGVYFDAYENFPGSMTKFVYYALKPKGLLKLLDENNNISRKLYLVYYDGPGIEEIFLGEQRGKLIEPPKPIPADTTVPYNYFFVPEGENIPQAYLPEQKQTPQNYFRFAALEKFCDWFKSN